MILLMLDYDGTLVPIKLRPELAKIPVRVKSLLERLARNPHLRLAIISGRTLKDVIRLVNIKGIYYVGCHGLEMVGPGLRFIHPQAKRAMPILKILHRELTQALSTIKGVLLENKVLTIAVHYRDVSVKYIAGIRKIIKKLESDYRKKLVCLRGRKVYEFIPRIKWNKGKAVKFLLKKLSNEKPLPIYIGDDTTDEDAFKILKGKGLTILVEGRGDLAGRLYPENTAASFRMKSVKQVYNFLQSLL
ncbi:MAG: trehalose-phosphatase [Candidatus Edwardsbacteria bacterium]